MIAANRLLLTAYRNFAICTLQFPISNFQSAICNLQSDMNNPRIYLSPPHMSGQELDMVKQVFDSNWIAPLGPQVDAFEKEFAEAVGVPYASALSSGTAALHLALRIIGVQPGDEVLGPTFTFAASANVITYEGGIPVFVDSSPGTWTIDPGLLREELKYCAERGRRPRAVMAVDLYGEPVDYNEVLKVCAEYEVPVIEDAAEALGASYQGKQTGSFGRMAAFSFNGNKVITTSGGGMLVSHDEAVIRKARFLATQARDPTPYYQHSEIGFNYRMSNVLAAIGRAQLKVLPERVAARRRIWAFYHKALSDIPGVSFRPEVPDRECSRWLTCIMVDPKRCGATNEDIRQALEKENIESRPLWKPMHLQPVFEGCRTRGGDVAAGLFEHGLCLPSGSALTDQDLNRICSLIRSCCRA
jgi:pyridoxal phosphate-dependent aminotransferase EpsN